MRVAVLGGGMGGLASAMELIERGVEVDVYEPRDVLGGKARSIVLERSGQHGFPAEHGFRFFPGFYRHVIDTMARIPLDAERTVVDNLVHAVQGMFARADGPAIVVPAVGPRSPADVERSLRALSGLLDTLTASDIEHFAAKIWQIMTSCRERRIAEYEYVPWAEFIDAADRSTGFREWFAGAMTRSLIAASGERASARTVGDVVVQMLVSSWKPGGQSDRLLNGPTNEVWIDPWVTYLEALGVRFHREHRVVELMSDDQGLGGVRIDDGGAGVVVTADHYVCAMPVEAMAPLVDDELANRAPSLAGVRDLATHVQWMSGLQVYLRRDEPILRGHTIYVGSEWGLTSVSQQQFWPHHRLSADSAGDVNGVVSVDVSNWSGEDVKGRTPHDCTPQQMVDEVLRQIRWCLRDRPVDLGEDNIHSWFIDPDIVFYGRDGTPESNAEPLLVNDAGTLGLRPHAYTEIENLFLASDYVRTETDLATMEGANEAARRAVNAILAREQNGARRARVWRLHEPAMLAPLRWADSMRFGRGEPWSPHVPKVLRSLAHMVGRVPALPGARRST